MDVAKQVDYWCKSAEEDMEVAQDLLGKDRLRHALFFAELAVEKALKAHVSQATHSIPPKIHDLLRLAEIARLALSAEQRQYLARFQQYCLEGRYPDHQPLALARVVVEVELGRAREVLTWLTNQLK